MVRWVRYSLWPSKHSLGRSSRSSSLMPKQKSKGAVKKRFRISKNGKAVCSHPDRGHGHAPFSGETGRRLRRRMVLNKTWSELVRNMIGK
ncbi:MAG: 50S ribosomal protein L35 [Planctomycetes bacterium]|nr:50S ribosomal protein L35 [Planctomycetota bacterium]